MDDLQVKVYKLISENLDVDEGSITMESTFADDLGADSLDTVELIMAFEEEFDIEIPDEDAEKMQKVSDVLEYLKSKVK